MDSEIYATPFAFVSPLCTDYEKETDSHESGKLSAQTSLAVVCSTLGQCKLMNLSSGHVKASYRFPHEVYSSPVVERNNIVVGCRDENMYCLSIERY